MLTVHPDLHKKSRSVICASCVEICISDASNYDSQGCGGATSHQIRASQLFAGQGTSHSPRAKVGTCEANVLALLACNTNLNAPHVHSAQQHRLPATEASSCDYASLCCSSTRDTENKNAACFVFIMLVSWCHQEATKVCQKQKQHGNRTTSLTEENKQTWSKQGNRCCLFVVFFENSVLTHDLRSLTKLC